MQRRNFLIKSIGLAASVSLPFPALAKSDWPAKPIRIVVPVPPGGSLDILARTIAKELTPKLNQPVVVENMAGGGSNIAFSHVAKAQPDGHTLLLGWDSLVINPSLYSSIPYTLQQFAPITLAITSPQVLVVGSKLPVNNLKEFIEAARKASGGLTLANAGSGSPGHLAGTLLETHTGLKFTNVPYKGGAPAVADLLAGHVDALMVTLPAAFQHIKAGRLKALGVTSAKRSTGASEIPTIAEAGVAGYELNSWQGILAPAGTPADIISTLNKHIVAILRDRAIRELLVPQGFEIVASSPDGLAKELARLTPRWAKLVQASGARVD
ncbi:Bug family tripartite tricarboxylate transporter substrate binding protein [Lacisediminimonas profundi]|uniref:Bug family tripartite tricarboxylate transporter substrate binding protein n=1 Tax=Lacisediminimonas profundi TaxID=2603856 RepID=UPI00124B19BD|nr:tripartite tricarboxylate transporter substrate binding protein [Lacisediminimonas profundi]